MRELEPIDPFHVPDRACRWCHAPLTDEEAPTMECFLCSQIPATKDRGDDD